MRRGEDSLSSSKLLVLLAVDIVIGSLRLIAMLVVGIVIDSGFAFAIGFA